MYGHGSVHVSAVPTEVKRIPRSWSFRQLEPVTVLSHLRWVLGTKLCLHEQYILINPEVSLWLHINYFLINTNLKTDKIYGTRRVNWVDGGLC